MHQNSLVDLSHVVKREHEEPEEITQTIKREFLFFFVGLPCLWSTTGSRSFSPEIPFPVNKKTSKGKAKIPTDTLRKPSGPIKLTSKLTVDSISTTTSLPSTWTVPRINSATLVDLSALDSLPRKPNGDEYSIDALIRAEVCLNASLHPYN